VAVAAPAAVHRHAMPTDPLAFFSKTGADGVSVRSHLAELIHSLLLSKDPKALEKLESISLEVKAAHYDGGVPAAKAVPTIPAGCVTTEGSVEVVPTEAWHKSSKALHKTDPEFVSAPSIAELPDQLPMFEWAGVGLPKQETYRIYLAMLALKKAHGLLAVRFFGKISGTKKDYVVIEGRAPASVHLPPSKVGATPPEAPGVGLNTFCYFVAPSAADEFTVLEDVTPEQILASSKIRKYFTGDLAAPVSCYPAFPGPESAYLRAQIARIAQATMLWPANKFVFDGESEASPQPIIDNQEYAVPDELTSLDSWVHVYGKILKIGRTTNVPKPEPVEGEEEAEAEEEEEEGPALGLASEDEVVQKYAEEREVLAELPAWSVQEYNIAYPKFAVAIAKSNRWPGAYSAIAKSGDKHACVYLGSGHENIGKAFTPVAPPPVMVESAETEEFEEPALGDENALLKEIDEAKNLASNGEGEEEDA